MRCLKKMFLTVSGDKNLGLNPIPK
jgi:hypothetical protein